jgi:hypothetical protein
MSPFTDEYMMGDPTSEEEVLSIALHVWLRTALREAWRLIVSVTVCRR